MFLFNALHTVSFLL
jgi:hypothetical protein